MCSILSSLRNRVVVSRLSIRMADSYSCLLSLDLALVGLARERSLNTGPAPNHTLITWRIIALLASFETLWIDAENAVPWASNTLQCHRNRLPRVRSTRSKKCWISLWKAGGAPAKPNGITQNCMYYIVFERNSSSDPLRLLALDNTLMRVLAGRTILPSQVYRPGHASAQYGNRPQALS